ncbi:hypothetical protein EDB84DRAFT_1568352 [Lactarius hengduanensis]|nr:hypothetical protein EDB84DRAFT_1568352 [Lactarius hengduanensis]
MASVQLVKVTHNIDNNVSGIDDDVRGVDVKVQVLNDQLQSASSPILSSRRQGNRDGSEINPPTNKGRRGHCEAFVISPVFADGQVSNTVTGNRLRDSLRKWQSPPDLSTNHNIAGNRQHEGTAEWFSESNQFESWKVTGSLLWIHGKPGSGKSVLCSPNINDLTTLCEAGSGLMAYFYFAFQRCRQASPPQLSSHSSSNTSLVPTPFATYSPVSTRHDNGARQPSDKVLNQCLREMLALPNQGPVYLIIDALDECPDTSDVPSAREQVLDLMNDLVGFRPSNLYICVTSRPEADICDALESLASQTVSLQDEGGQRKDIASYVRFVVYSGFRWVFCALEMLRNCLPQNVQRVLIELPKSLDETYERMLREIGKVNPDQAYRVLQFLTVATRPLCVDELAEVLALYFDAAKEGIKEDWRWDDASCPVYVLEPDLKEFLTSDRFTNLTADISRSHIRLELAHTVIA